MPCSGEQIVGLRLRGPAGPVPDEHHHWTFEIHELLVDGNTAVSEVTVTDDEQSACVVCFSETDDENIIHQTEYWPTA